MNPGREDMVRVTGVTAVVAVFAATAAGAQVTGEVVSRTIDVSQQVGSPFYVTQTSHGDVADGAFQYFADAGHSPTYNNYQVSTNIDNAAGYVAFANNASSAGNGSYMSARTSIQVNYTNPSSETINPTLTSTIIPGGFGLYIGNLSGNPNYTTIYDPTAGDFTPSVEDLNKTPLFAGYSGRYAYRSTFSYYQYAGSTSFSFQILSGATVVASYDATLTLTYNGVSTPTLTTNFSSPLANFAAFPSDDPTRAIDYAWDATPVSLKLGTLAPGASTSLTYVTTVTTQTFQTGLAPVDYPLIAYAGFGDPIGKTAGATGIADPSFPLLELGLPDLQVDPTSGDVSVTAATFDNTYTPSQLPISNQNLNLDPIPEPATWAMMLTGIGLMGGALRRRVARAV